MNEHFTSIQTTERPSRDWAAIRGELSIYLLAAVAIGLAILCSELMQLLSQQMETTERFHHVLEMHTETIKNALAAQKTGSSPQP